MRALLLSVLLLIASTGSAQTASFPVVSWLNDATHEAAGARMIAVMQARGLHPVVTCSAGCTLSVPSSEYATAISAANEVIAREHLDVTVLGALPSS
jgi:hypothetical protein